MRVTRRRPARSFQDVEVAGEAIRITRMLHRLLPDDGETAGLLALMILTHARRDARVGRDGALIPLADQDRGVLGSGRDPAGRRDRRARARHRRDWPVPAPGRDRRVARRGAQCGGDRLGADRRPLHAARPDRAESDLRPEPGGRGRNGEGARRWPGGACRDRAGRAARRPSPARGRARTHARARRRSRRAPPRRTARLPRRPGACPSAATSNRVPPQSESRGRPGEVAHNRRL